GSVASAWRRSYRMGIRMGSPRSITLTLPSPGVAGEQKKTLSGVGNQLQLFLKQQDAHAGAEAADLEFDFVCGVRGEPGAAHDADGATLEVEFWNGLLQPYALIDLGMHDCLLLARS